MNIAVLGTLARRGADYVSATGGTVHYDGNYKVHVFTESGDFVVSNGGNVEVLVVAGGGGGGSLHETYGGSGGGGAGGLLHDEEFAVTAKTYSVVVGTGGAAATDGGDSTFDTLTADGGGAGGDYGIPDNGNNGGSGGGGGGHLSTTTSGGTATAGQGNNGGSGYASGTTPCGGGGGGAGAVGANGSSFGGGNGGDGVSKSITGVLTYFAGGGGGARWNQNGINGSGGNGGGGAGNDGGTGEAGTNGRGGGGGGGRTGGVGGSGVVIIRYRVAGSYYNGGTYLYKDRVEDDSGTVVSISDIDSAYTLLKSLSTDPVVWYSAQAGWKNAGSNAVSKLYDLTSNNNDASASTGNPIWTASQKNGRATLVAAGDTYMTFTTTSVRYACVVFNRDADTATHAFMLGYSGYVAHYFGGDYSNATGNHEDHGNFHGASDALSPSGDQNTWRIFSLKYVEGENKLYIGRNGNYGTGVSQSAGYDYNERLNLLFCGSSSTYYLDGAIAEVIMFDDVPSSDDQAAILSYLNDKWDIY